MDEATSGMRRLKCAVGMSLLIGATGCAPRLRTTREPIVGGPCEGCEAVFEGLPAKFDARARIAPEDEPGEQMRIVGTVYDRQDRPTKGVIVYAYHTDAEGNYPKNARLRDTAAYRHGRLRGWARSDGQGRYQFDTIRPASYPNTENPAHVQMHVIEPRRCTYYIDSIMYDDDRHLTEDLRKRLAKARGGSGLATPKRTTKGTWIVRRDIRLGHNVPNYPNGSCFGQRHWPRLGESCHYDAAASAGGFGGVRKTS